MKVGGRGGCHSAPVGSVVERGKSGGGVGGAMASSSGLTRPTAVGSVVLRDDGGWNAVVGGAEPGGEMIGGDTVAVVLEGLSVVRTWNAALRGEVGFGPKTSSKSFLNC